MNKPKRKGTSLESAFVQYAVARTGDDRVQRMALHGQQDVGDVGWIWSHDAKGMAECKNYKGSPTAGQLEKWRGETLAERANGRWDWAMLVVHEPGCNASKWDSPTFGRNSCHITLGDLMVMAFGRAPEPTTYYAAGVWSTWVRLTLDEAFDIITGECKAQPEP